MEAPAVKVAAYCLDENTTGVKRIDELGHEIEAPAQARNVCYQNTIERARLLRGRFEQMYKGLASCERAARRTDVGLHKFFCKAPAVVLGILSTCPNLLCSIRVLRAT
jgi:hypothetical protein